MLQGIGGPWLALSADVGAGEPRATGFTPTRKVVTVSERVSEPIYVRGGFGSGAASGMSESLARAIAIADARDNRLAAQERRQRAERAAVDADNRCRASIELAVARGELVDIPRAWQRGGVGHTRGEFLSLISAQQDLQDAREQARRRQAFAAFEREHYANTSADTSATGPVPAEVAATRARVDEDTARRSEIARVAERVAHDVVLRSAPITPAGQQQVASWRSRNVRRSA